MSTAMAFFQILLMMLLAPGLTWWNRKMKAASQNRTGPSLAQVYGDLVKLLRKGMVISEQASWIFHAMPFVLFAATVAASMMVPVFFNQPLTGFAGDVILLVYLLALGKFFLALAALDTGTSFGGMGSSREMTFSALAEPSILLSFFALAYHARTLSLEGIIEHFQHQSPVAVLYFTSLAFGSMFLVVLAECGRIPVDNPATHLELTMIHEAMILEYSGRYLALIEWAQQIKQFIFLSLLANVFFPWGLANPDGTMPALFLSVAVFMVKIFVLSSVVGWVEIHMAKFRLFRVPDLMAIALVLAVLSLLGQMMVVR